MSSTQTLSSRIIELKGAISGLNFSIIFLLVMTTAYVVIRGLDLFLYLHQWKKEKDELKNKDSSKKKKDGSKKSSKNGSTEKSKKGEKQKTKSSKASSTLSSTKTKSTKNGISKSTKSGASTKTLTTKSTKNYKKNEPAKKKTLFDFGKKHENERASQDVDGIEKRKKPRERKIKKRLRQPKSDPFEESRKQLAKNTVDQIPT